MATRVLITDRDRGLIKILKGLRELDGKKVTIGLHDDLGVHPGANNSEHLTYAQIGAIQEYGARRTFLDGKPISIPSRPFTAVSFDKNKTQIVQWIKNGISAGMATGNFIVQMKGVGDAHAGYQRDIMDKWTDPPNSPRTIKYKLKDDPLDWTGAMIRAVKAKVE